MAVQAKTLSSLHSHHFQFPFRSLNTPPSSILRTRARNFPRKSLRLTCRSNADDEYLIDAPVSAGDGFSFSGGKYSDEPSPADEWFKQGKIVKAHPVMGSGGKAKDPIFGLKMGAGSQASDDVFRVSE